MVSEPRFYWSNIEPECMALAAAVKGNVSLFKAIWNAESYDPVSIERFKSMSDRHIHDTFFLLHEVVKDGHYMMLKVLVEEYGFSPYVMEAFIKDLRKQRAEWEAEDKRKKAAGEHIVLIKDDASWWLRECNPYKSRTLLEYTTAQLEIVDKKLQELSQKCRTTTL